MAELPLRPPEWIPTAPIVVRRQRAIAADAAAVWRRIADHETWPEWFTALDRVRVIGSAEGVGGSRAVTMMKRLTLDELFTAWEPDEVFAFGVVKGPFFLGALAESVELVPARSGCTVTYTQGIEPAARFGWFWTSASVRMGAALGLALDRLSVVVEAES